MGKKPQPQNKAEKADAKRAAKTTKRIWNRSGVKEHKGQMSPEVSRAYANQQDAKLAKKCSHSKVDAEGWCAFCPTKVR